MVMDTIFGQQNYRTEIIWKRTSAHSDTKQGRTHHGRIHDVLLFYTMSDEWSWNPVYVKQDNEYVDRFYKYIEPETGRRYRLDNPAGPYGAARQPAIRGHGGTRFCRYSQERVQELIDAGRIVQRRKGLFLPANATLTKCPAFRCRTFGQTSAQLHRKQGSGKATRRRNR